MPKFDAQITDLTPSGAPGLFFKELDVDGAGYLIFGEEGRTVLNPVHHFPWIEQMNDLEGHTLRIEVWHGGTSVLLRFIHFGGFQASQYRRIARDIFRNDPALVPSYAKEKKQSNSGLNKHQVQR